MPGKWPSPELLHSIRAYLLPLNSVAGKNRKPFAGHEDGVFRGHSAGPASQTLDVRVPVELKVRGGRKEIILPPDANTARDVGPQRPIVVALARAYKWQKTIESGQAQSLEGLAKQYGVDRSYAGRIIRLASLAPDIVQTVLAVAEPSGLSFGKLQQHLPLSWSQQRLVLGFRGDGQQKPWP